MTLPKTRTRVITGWRQAPPRRSPGTSKIGSPPALRGRAATKPPAAPLDRSAEQNWEAEGGQNPAPPLKQT
jgi:hypothetical protein